MLSVNGKAGGHLNQFLDRDAVTAWADHSGFAVESFVDGDKDHIPIPEEIRWENGTSMKLLGNLGPVDRGAAKSLGARSIRQA